MKARVSCPGRRRAGGGRMSGLSDREATGDRFAWVKAGTSCSSSRRSHRGRRRRQVFAVPEEVGKERRQ